MKLSFFLVICFVKIAFHRTNGFNISNSIVTLYTPILSVLRPCYAVIIKKDVFVTTASCLFFPGTYKTKTRDGVVLDISNKITHAEFRYQKGITANGNFDLAVLKFNKELDLEKLNINLTALPNREIHDKASCVLTDGIWNLHLTINKSECEKRRQTEPQVADVLCFRIASSNKKIEAMAHACKGGTPILCDGILVGVLPLRENCFGDSIYITDMYKYLNWIHFVSDELNDKLIRQRYRVYKKEILDSTHHHKRGLRVFSIPVKSTATNILILFKTVLTTSTFWFFFYFYFFLNNKLLFT